MSLSDEDRAAGWRELDDPFRPEILKNSEYITTGHGLRIAYRVAGEDQRAAAGNGGAEGTSTASQEAPGHERCQTAALHSETPETDAAFEDSRSTEERAARFHMLARKLEREAAALRRERQQAIHERDGMLEKLIAMTAERDALQRSLDAPCEEVEKHVHTAANFGEVVPAGYARDLHRRLVEAQEKLKIDELAFAAMHEDRDKERKRAESAEQRAMESKKDVERLIDIANDFQCLSYGEWAEKYHCTKPTTLRAAIDAAKAAEGGKNGD